MPGPVCRTACRREAACDDSEVRTSVIAPYAAYLRVYQPLAAFPDGERQLWESYAASADVGNPAAGVLAEHRRSLLGLLARPPLPVPPHESQDAFVIVVDRAPLICPWETRLRSWVALEDLRQRLSPSVVGLFLPPVVMEQAMADLDRWRGQHPDVTPHILTSTWHVPVRWFAAFADEERVLRLGEERSLYYRTPMAQARRRIARALRVLRSTVEDGPLASGVESLGRWLEEFHPRSQVELDYGGLVHLLDDDALSRDHSARDVTDGLAALAAGDSASAVGAYERMMERWRTVRALEHAS
jgi:hypothetical protein